MTPDIIIGIGISLIVIVLIPTFIFLYKFIKYTNKKIDAFERNDIFSRFSELFAIFNTCKEDAFDSLYRQEIYVFFTSKLADNDKKESLKKFEKVFIKRSLDMCGKSVVKELASLYGDTDAIILNLSTYFAKKITEINSEFTEFEMRDTLDEMSNQPSNITSMNKSLNRMFK